MHKLITFALLSIGVLGTPRASVASGVWETAGAIDGTVIAEQPLSGGGSAAGRGLRAKQRPFVLARSESETLECGGPIPNSEGIEIGCKFSHFRGSGHISVVFRPTGVESVAVRSDAGRLDALVEPLVLQARPSTSLYAITLESEGLEQTIYAIVRFEEGPSGPAEFIEVEPREALEHFRAAMRSNDLGKTTLLPLLSLLDMIPHDVQGNVAATALYRALEVAAGEGPLKPMVWICWTWCFETKEGFTCYDCYYGDFCPIGECCSHPYFSPKDKTGPCGAGPFP